MYQDFFDFSSGFRWVYIQLQLRLWHESDYFQTISTIPTRRSREHQGHRSYLLADRLTLTFDQDS